MSMNTKQQGDIGVAQAIYYYTKEGFQVSIPNTDSTKYDLIVDDGQGVNSKIAPRTHGLFRVQCKTTYSRREGVPVVGLRTMGGNQSWGGTVKYIEAKDAEMVWVCVEGTDGYEIPVLLAEKKSSLNLGTKYLPYKKI